MAKYATYQDRMTVDIPEGEVDGLRVERFEVTGLELWYLKQELRYGRGTKPGTYTKLVDTVNLDHKGNPTLWMSDTDAEKHDHLQAVAQIRLAKAERVLINGLGIGMVLAAALSFKHVRHVDVVEYDERVIKLVGPHYLKDHRVRIHHADAYEQVHVWPARAQWDVAWSDVWPDISDHNIPGMDQLHKYYKRHATWHGCWARRECLKLRRELDVLGIK